MARNSACLRGQVFPAAGTELRPDPCNNPALRSGAVSSRQPHSGNAVAWEIPILTARLPIERIKERWILYEAGIAEGGHDEPTRERLLAQAALWRNVYVADSDAQAEDELSTLLLRTVRT